MSAPLPPLLAGAPARPTAEHFRHFRHSDLKRVGSLWVGKDYVSLAFDTREKKLLAALEDDEAGPRVLKALHLADREVLTVLRRYGGSVNGTVLRLELQARGLLEAQKPDAGLGLRRWQRNPIPGLLGRLVLVPERTGREPYRGYSSRSETERPFEPLGLSPALLKHLHPARPVVWKVTPFKGAPAAIVRRSPAEVALDLARVFTYVTAKGQVKLNKSGGLGAPALKSLAKAVPLIDDSTFPLPEGQALYLEILRQSGAIEVDPHTKEARPDEAAGNRLFTQPTAYQARQWAVGWLSADYWQDGAGAINGPEISHYDIEPPLRSVRHVLAWALSCLAHADEQWVELLAFLEGLRPLAGKTYYNNPSARAGWKGLPETNSKDKQGEERERAMWYEREGTWFANALLGTLVALGLIERGQTGNGLFLFRLTQWGRAVFGAPEVPAPLEPADERFLVVQPNFDVLAYLDRAGAVVAGALGRLAEPTGGGATAQTFRLTQASVYRALEGGLAPAEVEGFLRRHSQNELPANVVRSLADWAGRRESLVVRDGVTVLGFPSREERDQYLAQHKGEACGDRFVLAGKAGPGALRVNHRGPPQSVLTLDEHGRLTPSEPLDMVRVARLGRLAERTADGWRLTRASVRRAVEEGIKLNLFYRWLSENLHGEIPPLLQQAIDVWQGAERPVALGEAVLLHVPLPEQFAAIAESERLRPLLAGTVGQGWLLVRREGRKELRRALAELGFTVTEGLPEEGLKQ